MLTVSIYKNTYFTPGIEDQCQPHASNCYKFININELLEYDYQNTMLPDEVIIAQ